MAQLIFTRYCDLLLIAGKGLLDLFLRQRLGQDVYKRQVDAALPSLFNNAPLFADDLRPVSYTHLPLS